VPVPQVLAWSSGSESGSVGIEYIIMEHVSGVALKDVWSQMTELQHIEFIESIGGLMKELCALDFGALGSLYLNIADKPPGAQPIDGEYCIGPHCGRQFWGYNDDQTTQTAVPLGFQGPCKFYIQRRSMSALADFLMKGETCPPFSQISLISAR
jgi:hypothetical protein